MQRIANGTQVSSLPTRAANVGTPGYGTNGDPGAGLLGSIYGADEFNTLQEELMAFLTAAGITPNGSNNAQALAAVRRMAGSIATFLTGSTTLTADQAGLVTVTASANLTLTLPAAAAAGGVPLRYEFVRGDATASVVTIARAGSDTIEGATSWTIAPGERLVLASDGTSVWRVAGEVATGRDVSANGRYPLPGRLLVQWGSFTTNTSAPITVTFPVAFADSDYAITLGHNSFNTTAVSSIGTSWHSATNFQVDAFAIASTGGPIGRQTVAGSYIAIGRR